MTDDLALVGTLDLTKLAAHLRSAGRHAGVVERVERVTTVASASGDLDEAADALSLLAELLDRRRSSEPTDDARDGPMAAALFAYAVLLYARATETKPIDRRSWFGRQQLQEHVRSWHRDVMTYRDKVLAHYGHGADQEEGPAIREALVMQMFATRKRRIDYVDDRARTRARLGAKLRHLIDEVKALARTAYDARALELDVEMKRVASFDTGFISLARSFVFDAQDWLGHDVEWSDLFSGTSLNLLREVELEHGAPSQAQTP